ncbi:MAG TPA: exodeoxyribonuclease VII large subunit [Clostridiaceae bacterium]|nr:exodeoxyribonuclease VII large subunit [Clostridiaceae bacterium]
MYDKPITVSQLNAYIKNLFLCDDLLQNVMVRGEVSNFIHHSSGHMYFTLKDKDSKIRCVMFRSNNRYLKFNIENGMNVIISGNVSSYERDGQYQLYCNSIEPDGVGSLYLKFEQLKEKLSAQGYFDKEHKKKLPLLPKRIGVVTSPTGAVIRDIINVSTRRFYNINIILYPSKVQGEDAAKSIAEGINYFNNVDLGVDVIIVGRGGGSIEELWPFNEEIVADAVYESKIPIVSAVGHETDFTICDFTADVRASTPSQAAEIVVPVYEDLKEKIYDYKISIINNLQNNIDNIKKLLMHLEKTIKLLSPQNKIREYIQYIDNIDNKIIYLNKNKIKSYRNELMNYINKIDNANPAKILSRGYSAVYKDEDIIHSIHDLSKDDKVNVLLKDGSFNCLILDVMEGRVCQEEKRN